MSMNSTEPLSGSDTGSVTTGDIDDAEVRAALDSSNPLVRQRGVEVCEALADDDVDAVRPLLDDVASLPDDDNAAIAMRSISVLTESAADDPAILDGRLDALVAALSSDIVDVQLTGATLLGKLVVERPDLVAPYTRKLAAALRATEPDEGIEEYGEFVDDPETRRTLAEHEREERKRRVFARRTLVNVVVAVTETGPEPALNAVEELAALVNDIDPGVAGGAVEALGQLAMEDDDAVAPVSNRLLTSLDHDRSSVRARAVQALGRLGDDAAVSKLRTVAGEDENEAIREIAVETVDFLTSE